MVFNNLTDYASNYQFVRVFLIEGVVLILLAIPARNSGAPGE